MLPDFFASVLDLIIKTSTDLPPDVRAAIAAARALEAGDSRSGMALRIIAENIDQAATGEGAICQDTGMPTFEVKAPVGANQVWMKQQIKAAVAEATRLGKLRPNSVDSITGENSGTNLGPGTPVIHFEQWERDEIDIRLILKGGGCENMNIQYSLPTELPKLGHKGHEIRLVTPGKRIANHRTGRSELEWLFGGRATLVVNGLDDQGALADFDHGHDARP